MAGCTFVIPYTQKPCAKLERIFSLADYFKGLVSWVGQGLHCAKRTFIRKIFSSKLNWITN